MPDGLICEATANGISSCNGSSCSAASFSVNQSLFMVTRSPVNSRRMTLIASSWRSRSSIGSTPKRMRVRGQRAGTRTEDRPPAGHVIELHHALRDIERMVIRQRDDPGGELDALRPLPCRGQEHFRRGDHFPAAGMMLAAPEFVVAELVQPLDQVEVAAELQHRVFADRMVRREKGAEIQARHAGVSYCVLIEHSAWRSNAKRAGAEPGCLAQYPNDIDTVI